MSELKLCKDCKHYDGKIYCKQKPPSKVDYVRGEHGYYSAQAERGSSLPDDCGAEAKFFEPCLTPSFKD